MMWGDPAVFGRKAERQRHLEFREGVHLSIEPLDGVGAEAVGPGEAGSEMLYAEAAHPAHGLLQTVIVEMKPLAQPHHVRILFEGLASDFRRAVLAQQSHVEVPIVGRSLGLPMPSCRFPCRGKVVKAVPMNPWGSSRQQFCR